MRLLCIGQEGGDASEEKHIADVVFGGVPVGGVLGRERASVLWDGCVVDGDAGGVGGLVNEVGIVGIRAVWVMIGFLGVLLVWLFLLWKQGKREVYLWLRMYRCGWMVLSW